MAILCGLSKDEIQSDRTEVARKWAKSWGHVVVLKGAYTVVASPKDEVTIIPIAQSALASAGTGDVLTGAIASFRAQGLDAYQAAILGSYVHGMAGEIAADNLGTSASVMAGDVADGIAMAIAYLELSEEDW
jgi:NAD(P)H-hydrate epimerase